MPPTLSARHRSSNRPFGMVLGRIGTWFRQRRDTHLLESLSDDQLKDIGVSGPDRRDREASFRQPLEDIIPVSQFNCQQLLGTAVVTVHDVLCQCGRQHRSAEECTQETHLVFRTADSTCAMSGAMKPWRKRTRCCSSMRVRLSGEPSRRWRRWQPLRQSRRGGAARTGPGATVAQGSEAGVLASTPPRRCADSGACRAVAPRSPRKGSRYAGRRNTGSHSCPPRAW